MPDSPPSARRRRSGRAVERGIPTVVSIREPSSAIASLITYQGMAMHVRLGLESYIAFYRRLVPLGTVLRYARSMSWSPIRSAHLPAQRPVRLGPAQSSAGRRGEEGAAGCDRSHPAIAGRPGGKWSVPVSTREVVRTRLVDPITCHPRFSVAARLYRTLVGGRSSLDQASSIGARQPAADPSEWLARA